MALNHLKRKIRPIDPVATRSPNELVTALSGCSFQGRSLSFALDVWETMCRDKECVRVISLAGAMVPAGMGLVVIRLMEAGLLDAIVCTGATVSHDLCNLVDQEEQAHFIGHEHEDDEVLRAEEINRIYDTYLPETAFRNAEQAVAALLPTFSYDSEADGILTITTARFMEQLGAGLKGTGILTVAARRGVRIFVPAISDSELGLNVLAANTKGVLGDGRRVVFDTLGDVDAFSQMIAKGPLRAGLVTVGGGVPRNWAQQVYPYLNMKAATQEDVADGYHYGVRITTDRPEFGGLSGCTISESKSWGKYENEAVEASVVCDATIAFPLLTSALFERLGVG